MHIDTNDLVDNKRQIQKSDFYLCSNILIISGDLFYKKEGWSCNLFITYRQEGAVLVSKVPYMRGYPKLYEDGPCSDADHLEDA